MNSSRVLAWDGCVNVRDLGGLPTEDGRETRFGQVVRADSIRGLTHDGWSTLVDYGVRLAVDLRDENEASEDPPGDVPIRVVHIPIEPRRVPPAYAWPSMREAYLALLEHFPGQFAAAIEEIGRSDVPVVVHCSGGRDRTGLTVALLLRLARVDPQTIAADHALSDESWGPFNEEWFAEAPSDYERARRQRIATPAGRTMVEVLAEVDARWGGAGAYLLGGGAEEDILDTVVLRLRS